MSQHRLARLVADLEAQGARFLLIEDQIEVEGMDPGPWFAAWLDRHGYNLRRILRGELPEPHGNDQDDEAHP